MVLVHYLMWDGKGAWHLEFAGHKDEREKGIRIIESLAWVPGADGGRDIFLPREWKSKDGRTLQGKLIEVDHANATVAMKRADGLMIPALPMSALSPQDKASLDALKQPAAGKSKE